MPLRRYRMYATASSTTAALDSFTVPRKGKLKQIMLSARVDSVTDNAVVQIAVSRSATNDVNTAAAAGAPTTQSLLDDTLQGNFVTSGLAQIESLKQISFDDDVNIGDVLYIHANISGTATFAVNLILVIAE